MVLDYARFSYILIKKQDFSATPSNRGIIRRCGFCPPLRCGRGRLNGKYCRRLWGEPEISVILSLNKKNFIYIDIKVLNII
jgi:hypothetical protein